MDIEHKTDEELVNIIKKDEENDKAFKVILDRYEPVIAYKSKRFFVNGAEESDIKQEGIIGLLSAIKNYKKDDKTSFKTFANLCIERNMITAIKTSMRQKQYCLNNAISYNQALGKEGEDKTELLEALDYNKSYVNDPFEILADKENYRKVTDILKKSLSTRENAVLDEYLKGYSYNQIAENLHMPKKSVDTALTRIRRKGSAIWESYNNL